VVSPRKTPVTAFSVPVAFRDVVNRLALDMSAELGRRISMAAVVIAAVAVAREHPQELRAALTAPADTTPGGER
jgi:hypothetical protein